MRQLPTEISSQSEMGLLNGLIYYGGIALAVLVCLVVLYSFLQLRSHSNYFKSRGIPFYGSSNLLIIKFIMGKISLPEMELLIYKDARKAGHPLIGISDATGPVYYVSDLDFMRYIFVKDFDHFVNRRPFSTSDNDMFTKMLITLEGDHWKLLRSKLSPTFTTSRIRGMFEIFDRSSSRLCDYLGKYIPKDSGADLDVTKFYSKYTMDVIANCAFGLDSKSFGTTTPEQKSEFEEMGARFAFKVDLKLFFKLIFITFFPNLAKKWDIKPFDSEPQDYFTRVVKDVMNFRRKNGSRQNDFLQLMMDVQDGLMMNEENSKEAVEVLTGDGNGDSKTSFESIVQEKIKFDDDVVIANCELFFMAGFDTIQSLLIFGSYMIAKEQDVQERLFKEVEKCFIENGGKLSYDGAHQMPYLDAFINETLRFFPPATSAERVCSKDYTIPGTNWVIEKGKIVTLPIYGVHHDEAYYENPENFNPERFMGENKGKRHPFSFSPFGHGPRNCIGMRFALTEAKTALCHLVYNYKFEPCSKTDMPPKFSNAAIIKPANGMWLRLLPRVH